MDFIIRVVKTKALISFAITVKLICAFGFAYADCWFSHDITHIYLIVIFALFLLKLVSTSSYSGFFAMTGNFSRKQTNPLQIFFSCQIFNSAISRSTYLENMSV